MARALADDPIPPGVCRGALARNTSYTPSSAQSAASSFGPPEFAQGHAELPDQAPGTGNRSVGRGPAA